MAGQENFKEQTGGLHWLLVVLVFVGIALLPVVLRLISLFTA
ncbi:hypothetical protein [Aliidiomarina haloalkalitolerans]|nr:hypothetical protein [Aliidiomarina haloalkalitolerans]